MSKNQIRFAGVLLIVLAAAGLTKAYAGDEIKPVYAQKCDNCVSPLCAKTCLTPLSVPIVNPKFTPMHMKVSMSPMNVPIVNPKFTPMHMKVAMAPMTPMTPLCPPYTFFCPTNASASASSPAPAPAPLPAPAPYPAPYKK